MQKTDILKKANQYHYLESSAQKYADLSLTDEQASEERKRLKKMDETLKKAQLVLSILGVLAIFAWMFLTPMSPRADGRTVSPLLGAVVLGTSWALASYLIRDAAICLLANKDLRKMLRPLAGTVECEESLDCLKKGGPLVTEWRDIAVAERGQLRQYDAHIMYALAVVHQDEVSRAERKARFDAACKEVHGIAEITA